MAEEHQGGEPTEPPSEKKLRDARKKGDVPRSRDVVAAAVFAGVAGIVAWTWPDLVGQLREAMAAHLRGALHPGASPTAMLHRGLSTMLLAVAPVLIASFTVALVSGYAQVGTVFSTEPLKPSLRRLDPIKNAKNIFGKTALFELFKSLVKVLGIGYVAFTAFWDRVPRVIATLGQPPENSVLAVADCVWGIAVRVLVLAAVLAALDHFYQRWRYTKRQRMTKYEVRREQKEMEGDPQRKAERRRIHQEILEHQMIEAVADADCVIINPEHVAVALRYDEKSMGAPRVVARGRRIVAAKIRQIARQKGVPIVRNVPLARALVELELDDEIPPDLYEAVAEVLRFVYRISGRQPEEQR
jgi:flagellar biosynthetic protein FlhB